MIKELLICDGCGTDKDVLSYRINTGVEMDASGNGYNINWEHMEFCPKCKVEYQNKHKDFKICEK